jgi:toluene monooxygenase system ferredoxin subunit
MGQDTKDLTGWEFACDVNDMEDEDLLECRVNGIELLLVRSEGGIVACPVYCPHMEERLVEGFCDGKVLTCAKHLWQWDLETGAAIGLAEKPLPVSPVRIEDDKVYVDTTLFQA